MSEDYLKQRKHVKKDMQTSITLTKLLKNKIIKALNLKQLIPIETYHNNIALKTLDISGGIDYIGVKKDDDGVIGIANRVQWEHLDWTDKKINIYRKNKGYRTFTIRLARYKKNPTNGKLYLKKTMQEYQKRIIAIKKGYNSPIFTIQSYFSDKYSRELLSFCIIKTRDLFQFIEAGKQIYDDKQSYDYYIEGTDKRGIAHFIVVEWKKLLKNFKLYIYPKSLHKLLLEEIKYPVKGICELCNSKKERTLYYFKKTEDFKEEYSVCKECAEKESRKRKKISINILNKLIEKHKETRDSNLKEKLANEIKLIRKSLNLI